jgi:hypothetical protein
VLLGFLVVGTPAALASTALGTSPMAVAIGVGAGMLLFCWLTAAAFSVLAPICVLERITGTRAVGRNLELTEGQRGHGMAVIFLGGSLTGLFTGVSVLVASALPLGWTALLGAKAAGDAFNATLVTLLYRDLRVRSEVQRRVEFPPHEAAAVATVPGILAQPS